MVFQVNVPVGQPAKPNETAPRRYFKTKEGSVSRPRGMECNTLYEYFNECVKMHGADSNCQGWRDLVDVHYEKKLVKKIIDGESIEVEKEWIYYEKSDYKYISFGQLQALLVSYGKGLNKIGVVPGNKERLHIFASTSAKWMRTFLAAQTQSIPIVTAYDSLGEDGLIHSLTQTNSVGIFTDNDLLIKLVNPLKKATDIRYIIHSEPIVESDKRGDGRLYKAAKEAVAKIKEIRPDIKFYSYDEVIALGEEATDIEPVIPKPEDLACIMYTSGSTGPPKGVVLTHQNVVASVGGISYNVPNNLVTKKDRIIAFLPLAHIFELVFELIAFHWGGIVGYASVKTLTEASCKNCEGDMKAFKPTIMVGVAAVWESVKKGIMAQIAKLPPTTQKIFWAAYSTKLSCKKYHIPLLPGLIDSLLFKKIKAATGGQLRFMLNGGSPISEATQRFVTTVMDAPMLIGYGLTETTANACVMDPDHFEYGCAGALVGSVTAKLIDVSEAGYFAKNNQGEVLLTGLAVTKEYYKNEQETKLAFEYEPGWFSTGDIGQWLPNGQLKLIDRKKNLIKTQNGEYIALEKLESIYRSAPIVNNICCYADETKVKPMAIVVPIEAAAKSLIVELGLAKKNDDIHLADFVDNKKLAAAITKQILSVGKEHGLTSIELILGVVIVDEEWTPESGFVTSAQKLQRKKILASVQDRVDKLYAEN